MSTHLSLSKVLAHSRLEHSDAELGGGLLFSLPFAPHPFLQSPVAWGSSPASQPLVWGLGSLLAPWHSLIVQKLLWICLWGRVPK